MGTKGLVWAGRECRAFWRDWDEGSGRSQGLFAPFPAGACPARPSTRLERDNRLENAGEAEAASVIPVPGWRKLRVFRCLPFKGGLETWDSLVAWFNELAFGSPRIVHAGLTDLELADPGSSGKERGGSRPRPGPHPGVHVAADRAQSVQL